MCSIWLQITFLLSHRLGNKFKGIYGDQTRSYHHFGGTKIRSWRLYCEHGFWSKIPITRQPWKALRSWLFVVGWKVAPFFVSSSRETSFSQSYFHRDCVHMWPLYPLIFVHQYRKNTQIRHLKASPSEAGIGGFLSHAMARQLLRESSVHWYRIKTFINVLYMIANNISTFP